MVESCIESDEERNVPSKLLNVAPPTPTGEPLRPKMAVASRRSGVPVLVLVDVANVALAARVGDG